MEKEKYINKMHTIGRFSTSLAILFFLSYPAFVSIYFDALPKSAHFFKGFFSVAVVFWVVGFIEAFTFPPMLGVGGTYLGFVTGNLTAMKVPVALNAMETMKTEPGTYEAEIVSTVAIAVSSITTIIILFFGMLLLRPLQPLLQSPVLKPAFDNILPALFGGLGTVFVAKNIKIAIAPIFLMTLLFILFPALSSAVSVMVPVSVIFTIIVSRILYKKGKI
ncbi:MAG: hypothetical protein P1P64_04055 [Treponemataceae bacterium]